MFNINNAVFLLHDTLKQTMHLIGYLVTSEFIYCDTIPHNFKNMLRTI